VNDALVRLEDFLSGYPETLAVFISRNLERLQAMQGGMQALFNVMASHPAIDYRVLIDRVNLVIRTAITDATEAGVQEHTSDSSLESVPRQESFPPPGFPPPMPSDPRHDARATTSEPVTTSNMRPAFFIPGSNDAVMDSYTEIMNRFQDGPTWPHQDHNRHSQESLANQNRYSQESIHTQPEVFHMTGVNTPARQSPERYDHVHARVGRSSYVNGTDIAQGMLPTTDMGGSVRSDYFERLGRPFQREQQSSHYSLAANHHQQPPNMPQPYLHMPSEFEPQPYFEPGQQGLRGQQHRQVQQAHQVTHMRGMGVAYRDETHSREPWQRQMQPTTDMRQERLRQEEQINREWLRSVPAQRMMAAQDAQQDVPRNLTAQPPRPPRTYVPGQGPHLRDIHPAHRP